MRQPASVLRPLRAGLGMPPEAATLGLTERALVAIAALPAACASFSSGHLSMTKFGIRSVSVALLRYMLVLSVLQVARRLQKQGARSISERDAAVEGSRFSEVAPGVVLHHTLCPPPSGVARSRGGSRPLLVHCAHGFGANALTWDPLFERLGAAFSDAAPNAPTWLVASDRLGFGLSPRPRDVRLYGQEEGATFALRLVESLVPLCAGQPSSPRSVFDAPQPPGRLAISPQAARRPSADGTVASADAGTGAGGVGDCDSDETTSDEDVAETPAQREVLGAPPLLRPPPPSSSSPALPAAPSAAPHTLLIGHSLGGAMTARMAVQAVRGRAAAVSASSSSAATSASTAAELPGTRGVGGIVLIAPALIAPPASPPPDESAAGSASGASSKLAAVVRPAGRAVLYPLGVLAHACRPLYSPSSPPSPPSRPTSHFYSCASSSAASSTPQAFGGAVSARRTTTPPSSAARCSPATAGPPKSAARRAASRDSSSPNSAP